MRIAFCTYSTQARGGVVHALSVAEALHDLGHDVVLYALDDTGAGFQREPRCPYRLVRVAREREDLAVFVRRRVAAYVEGWDAKGRPFDVYHAQDGISGNALATLVTRGVVPRFVRTIHHVDDFADDRVTALQERSIVSAERCFVVSDVWRRFVASRFGIDAGIVGNGVDPVRFVPVPALEREALRRRLAPAGGPLFVSIGGVEARKNALRTLEAFALVRRSQPNALLVIAGGASVFDHSAYRRTFDQRAAQLGLKLEEDVVVTGVVDDRRIVDLLRAADALVFPSLVEGFGLVLLEALACETPVVTSAIPPFTEFLTSEDALLVDPYDAAAIAAGMERALLPQARDSAAGGRRIAERFSWRASAEGHVAQYRESALREVYAHA